MDSRNCGVSGRTKYDKGVKAQEPEQSPPGAPESTGRPAGAGGWLIEVVLLALLACAFGFAFYAWNMLGDVEMSATGTVAMVLGVVVSFVVGAGLMGLVFRSSRKGYDR